MTVKPTEATRLVAASGVEPRPDSSVVAAGNPVSARPPPLARDATRVAHDPPPTQVTQSSLRRYHLSFRYDDEANRVIVRVIDSESGELIRSIPPDDIVRALQRLRAGRGSVVDEEA